MRSITYGLIIGIILLCAAVSWAAKTSVPEDPLAGAMQAAGVPIQEISVNGWAQLAGGNLTDRQMEDKAAVIMQKLGVRRQDCEESWDRSDDRRSLRLAANRDRFAAYVSVQVLYPQHPVREPEAYVVANVDMVPDGQPLASWRQKVTAGIAEVGGFPRITTCVSGWLDDKLEKDQMIRCTEKAFRATGAHKMDQYEDEYAASYTGYSPAFSDWLLVDRKRVNINMAIRYSTFDNRTYFMIGSPVITREY